MIKYIKRELTQRITMVITSICIVTVLTIIYTNEFITVLLHPIKHIHTDWHMDILYKVLNTAFEVYDKEVCIKKRIEENKEFDYIPVIEINMNISNTSIAIVKILIHITMIFSYTLLKYQCYLVYSSSLYKKEQKSAITTNVTDLFVISIAAIYTQQI